MDEEQPTFKVVDRRPFNPDGTPRELSPEEKAEAERAAAEASAPAVPPVSSTATKTSERAPSTASTAPSEAPPQPRPETRRREASPAGRDPLDDPASFLSLIMSLASNAAANLGMMPHPVTGETGVDLLSAKHWIDVIGMLEEKTKGNLSEQEDQVLEGLLADLRMQFVSLQNSPTPPPAKFSASDITGGK
jgi:Domain of unknown function (DUF1844)